MCSVHHPTAHYLGGARIDICPPLVDFHERNFLELGRLQQRDLHFPGPLDQDEVRGSLQTVSDEAHVEPPFPPAFLGPFNRRTPWATLDLRPYRMKCLADEHDHVVRAVRDAIRDWHEALPLIQKHVNANVFCLR